MPASKVQLVSKRGTVRMMVTKCAKRVDEELIKPEPSADELGKLKSMLLKYSGELESFDDQILEHTEKETEASKLVAELDKETEQNAKYACKILEATASITVFFDKLPKKAHIPAAPPFHEKFASLPKLKIDQFDGNPLNWPPFWDAYDSAVYSNPGYSDSTKFTYLKGLIRTDSIAWHAIDQIPVTNANFEPTVAMLKNRFGKKQLIQFAHVEKLLAIPQLRSSEATKLRNLFDEFERHFRGLGSQGITEDRYGIFMIPLVLTKLPNDVRLIVTRKNGTEDWTLKNLRTYLQEEIEARELSSLIGHQSGTNSTPQQQQQRSSTASLTTTPAQGQQGGPYCVFCNERGSHFSDQCTTFPTVEARLVKLRQSHTCFRCLRSFHRGHQCQRDRLKPCFYCKSEEHHSALCPSNSGGSQPSRGAVGSLTSQSQETTPQTLGETATVIVSELNVRAPEFIPESVVQSSQDELRLLPEAQSNAQSCDVARSVLQFTLPVEQRELPLSQPSVAAQMAKRPSSKKTVFLQTALAEVWYCNRSTLVRLLFDTASLKSFVTIDVIQRLNIHISRLMKDTISVSGFGGNTVIQKSSVVQLSVKSRDGLMQTITCSAVSEIVKPLVRAPLNVSFPLSQISDPPPKDDFDLAPVDILVGSDYYYDFIDDKRTALYPGVFVVKSTLGNILSGPCEAHDFSLEECLVANVDLQMFWDLESIGIPIKEESVSLEEEAIGIQFQNSLQFKDGRYEVALPWKFKEPNLHLPTNYLLALNRLRSLLRRLSSKPDLLKQYDCIFQEQLKTGIIEMVDENTSQVGLQHYIPHHVVVREDHETTKIRIVYNASAKTHNCPSLNDCLFRGPIHIADLCMLLMEFRTKQIGLIADLAKAFLNVGLQLKDRDVTRFLWVKNIDLPPDPENLVIMRFRRVPFGIISSPYMLNGAVDFHLSKYKEELAEMLRSHLYVDNLIAGGRTEEECQQIYDKSKAYFRDMGMNLTQWASSSELIRNWIPKEDQSASRTQKVLGLQWNLDSDELNVKSIDVTTSEPITKRKLLQTVAKVFDPLGMITPVVVDGKVLMQELWLRDVKWDEAVPDDLLKRCQALMAQLADISSVKLPRFSGEFENSAELHCFVDSSMKVYATAIYLKSRNSVQLIFSKSRMVPTKPLSLPKKELMALVIGVRCVKFIRDNVDFRGRVVFWSDSRIVLHWLQTKKQFSNVFVENRVKEIKEKSPEPELHEFRYVPTDDNPSDLPTRGMSVQALINCSLWWTGPEWLRQSQENWPVYSGLQPVDSQALVAEVETTPVVPVLQEDPDVSPPFGINLSEISSLVHLLRVAAWANRFISNCRKRQIKKVYPAPNLKSKPLTAKELSKAKKQWVHFVQASCLSDVIEAIKKKNYRHPLVKQLGLALDDQGFIVCEGRMMHSEMKEPFPKLLPKKHHFTDLVIVDAHKRVFHFGAKHTLARIREQFWIPAGRARVQSLLNSCSICKRWQGGPYVRPPMAALPDFRVNESAPFSYSGCDYFGPMYVKEGHKVWCCLFTCAVVRAVHVELVPDLSAYQFVLALKRFINRRGKPRMLICDNSPTFKLAHDHLSKDYCAQNGIVMNFIVELAPWMGGMYERLIGTVKRSLKKTVGKASLSYVQLETVLSEIEHVVNTRPLTFVGKEMENVLTPNDFLCPNANEEGTAFEVDDDEDEFSIDRLSKQRQDLVNKARALKALLDSFWKSWKTDYLGQLRESHSMVFKDSRANKDPIQVGDVVLLEEKGIPRGRWPMGKVCELVISKDGRCRSALVLSKRRKKLRSISMLYPIEQPIVARGSVNSD